MSFEVCLINIIVSVCRWILQAMRFALSYETPDISLFSLSPSEISDLITQVLKDTKEVERKR